MNKNIKYYLILASFLSILYSCGYPEYEVEYSEAYPVCGAYYVSDYDYVTKLPIKNQTNYELYIFNKSYNPTKDSIWIDNYSGHSDGLVIYPYKFKIKTKADLTNLSFNCEKLGNVTGTNLDPLSGAVSVSITNSVITDYSKDIKDPKADSIYFEFTYYDKDGVETMKVITAGHRKTGWETPEFTDPME